MSTRLTPHAVALAEAIVRSRLSPHDLMGLARVIRAESRSREHEQAAALADIVHPGMLCRLRNVAPVAFNGALCEVVEVRGTRASVRIIPGTLIAGRMGEGAGVFTVSCASLAGIEDLPDAPKGEP